MAKSPRRRRPRVRQPHTIKVRMMEVEVVYLPSTKREDPQMAKMIRDILGVDDRSDNGHMRTIDHKKDHK